MSYPFSLPAETLPLQSWRVLVVDDQPDNLALASAVFGSRCAEVLALASPLEALKLIDSFKPTVILLDLAMPEMTGWEMVKLIREREGDRHIPVIALSVRVSVTDGEKAKDAGFDGYIAKPFSIATIFSEIQDIMEQL